MPVNPTLRRALRILAHAPLTMIRGLRHLSRRAGICHFTLPLAFLLLVREYQRVSVWFELTPTQFSMFVLFLFVCLLGAFAFIALGLFKAWHLEYKSSQ